MSVLFSACTKDDNTPLSLSINKSEISLSTKQSGTIVVSPSATGCTFTSENKYIATVSPDGKVTPVTVGTTYITVSNSAQKFTAKCKITVTPTLNLFKEPYLNFGATRAIIRENESRTLTMDIAEGLSFKGENSNIISVMYLFTNGKMNSAAAAVPANKLDTTMDFLAERYIPISYRMVLVFTRVMTKK